MGDDDLSLLQELVRYSNTFAQQPTGVATQIENQSFEIAELVERVGNFMFRGLVESVDVHIPHAGPDQEVDVDAVTRDLVADQGELHRLLHAFARDADVNGCAPRSFKQVGDVTGAHV